jgi:hypothetical protein
METNSILKREISMLEDKKTDIPKEDLTGTDQARTVL